MRNQAKMKADELQHQQKAEEARGAVDFYGKAGLNVGLLNDNAGSLAQEGQVQGVGSAGNVHGQAVAPKTPVVERSDRKVGPHAGHGNNHEEPRRQNTVQTHKAGSPLTGGARAQDGRVTSNPASSRQAQLQQPLAAKNPNIIKQNNFFTPT